jgi:hypothetical protein
MKLKNLSNWEYCDDLNCMLYFAQCIDEMLFNYTLDSYKAPALNSHTLCNEALLTIIEVKNGIINKGAIQPILEELEYSLKTDIISKSIYNEYLDTCLKKLKPTTDLDELYSLIELIKKGFENYNFLNGLTYNLKEKITQNLEKENIYFLSRIFITELINLGYNKNFIHRKVNDFFFSNSKITSTEQLDDFFKIFNFTINKYDVIFFTTRLFNEIKEVSSNLSIFITDSINEENLKPSIKNYINNVKSNKLFATITVETIDYYSAFFRAEKQIEKVTCLFNFFHHKNKLNWKTKILIRNNDTNEVFLIDKPESSILNCKDLRPNQASKDLKKIIKNFSFKPDSFERINKSLDLHSYALNAESIDNQMLNIWTAIETLIPKKVNQNKDRIIQISDVILPFQGVDYIKKIVQYFQKNLIDWNFTEFRHICEQVGEGNDTLEKISAFICLSKYQTLRNEISSKLVAQNYLILNNRLFFLNKTLSSIDNIKEILTNHIHRVNWHIQRIYRTRNLIVHSGQYFSFTPILIENLHTYFDLVIKQIFKLRIVENRVNTLEQSYTETNVRLEFQLDFLNKNKGKKIDEVEYITALFGIN